MSVRLKYALGLIVALGVGCKASAPRDDSPRADAAPVELVGAGTISTIAPEFATSLSPTGDTLFFNRASADRSEIVLLYSTRSGGAWGPPQPFGPTEGIRAIDPFIDATGRRVYFSSDLPMEGAPDGDFNLWFVGKTGDGWSSPTALPTPINSDSSEVFNSFALDGTMVFSSNRDGVDRIYSSRLEGDGATEPIPIQFGAIHDGSNAAISPDGALIVFARSGPDGPSDLYVSCREDSGWNAPVLLPEPINSPYTDFAPGFSAGHLYFSSERPGVAGPVPESVRPPGDIYRTPLEGIASHCM